MPKQSLKPTLKKPNRSTATPEWESINDAVRATGLCRSTIGNVIADGRIEARKFGPRVLVNIASRRAFMNALPKAAKS